MDEFSSSAGAALTGSELLCSVKNPVFASHSVARTESGRDYGDRPLVPAILDSSRLTHPRNSYSATQYLRNVTLSPARLRQARGFSGNFEARLFIGMPSVFYLRENYSAVLRLPRIVSQDYKSEGQKSMF